MKSPWYEYLMYEKVPIIVWTNFIHRAKESFHGWANLIHGAKESFHAWAMLIKKGSMYEIYHKSMIYAHSLKNSQKLSYYEICSYEIQSYYELVYTCSHLQLNRGITKTPFFLFALLTTYLLLLFRFSSLRCLLPRFLNNIGGVQRQRRPVSKQLY